MKPNIRPVNLLKMLALFLCVHGCQSTYSQPNNSSTSIALVTGVMNYQGDLNPNSFNFKHGGFATGILIRKPINRWLTARGGIITGTIKAADKWNKDELKARNLSFTSAIIEGNAGLELNLLDMSSSRFTPYLYGGLAVFHFNPWTIDKKGSKIFLKPLSTEGQGIADYPAQKPYQLTQVALSFGIGFKFAVSDAVQIGVEFSQRKTFTDYLDDVSSNFVDVDVLRQARGEQAVELAYRGDEIPNGRLLFPSHGDQRGTPSQMDWYYFTGLITEIKLDAINSLFTSGNRSVKSQRCPRNVSY